ncbi:MAG: adenine deaminase [Eubacteriaceae bacterium]|nr:adenine deaminase [Eubacteriaceae bacterium]
MKTLLKNGTVVNVFTDSLCEKDVLIEDGVIIGVDSYTDTEADHIEDVTGKYICPGFIDGHIHIESTMMTPTELSKSVLIHGTTGIVADPHEIANVCGKAGIEYMLKASENLPLSVFLNLPSCVPSTPLDESGATLTAEDLMKFYDNKRILGLAEMMNYYGVVNGDKDVLRKIEDALAKDKIVDGHAPLLTGRELDKYVAAGVQSDHECSSFAEGSERIEKGQWVMIRQGTAARNLEDLIDLFDEPWNRRCILVTDDKHPSDIYNDGHIDAMIRMAGAKGKSIPKAIRMATLQAAQCFGLKRMGAVAPGYRADLLVLNSLEQVEVRDVYCNGVKVVNDKKVIEIKEPELDEAILNEVNNTFNVEKQSSTDFIYPEESNRCRVIRCIPGQLLTEEYIADINWSENNGIDLNRDILKISVIERHRNTGHRGIGFIQGIGLKKGAIASSISHDSHNIIVIGTNAEDMACVANCVIEQGGGCAAVCDGKVLSKLSLPIAGLMADLSAQELSRQHEHLMSTIYSMGSSEEVAPLMTMAFISLTVIPYLKINTFGLVDVTEQKQISLYV